VEKGDVRIREGKIVERGVTLQPQVNETVHDLRGKVVLPGFVCAHTHLYSTLARGMPAPTSPPRNFLEILQKIWWKLDRGLDEQSIYYSALVGGIEAARCGTTTLIDHHASPNFIRGSLSLIREALSKVGVRGVLCYEVTDRGGRAQRDEGLEENEAFLQQPGGELYRGLVGAHASFTLSEESLRACADLAQRYGTGLHIHVAEDPIDQVDAQQKYGRSVVTRLHSVGALTPRAVLAHGTHLSDEDLALVREHGAWLIHNARSNMNNAVGYAPVEHFGPRSALGTDGFPAAMLEETRLAFFKSRDARTRLTPVNFVRLLQAGNELCSELFGETFGTLAPGAVADLVILDYTAPTPLTSESLPAHALFGMTSAQVESVMAHGEFVVFNRRWLRGDADVVFEEARRVAENLWSRMVEKANG